MSTIKVDSISTTDDQFSASVEDIVKVTGIKQELASPSGAAMVGLPQGGTLNAALKFVTPAMKGDLQTAINYAVDNGALLVLDEAEYETGEMLTANGPLSIYV